MKAVGILSMILILLPLISFGRLVEAVDPLELTAELDRIAKHPIWPGFDPIEFPLALYTGEQTLLFRHPRPPEGFARSPANKNLWVYEGRHPAVVANTTTELGGVITATLLLNLAPDRSAREWAAVAAHEAFHAFQGRQYPEWGADEGSLFLYPVDNAENYMRVLLESKALARALAAEEAESSARWAAKALALRGERYSILEKEPIEYERGIELFEGTAFYVEYSALDKAADTESLLMPHPPADIRLRLYSSGRAFAVLLDRFDEGWKERLKGESRPSLDLLLRNAIATGDTSPAEFSDDEIVEARELATAGVERLVAERRREREAVLSAKGWQVSLEVVNGEPLWPHGFDPMNILYLGDHEILHKRFLKLGNSAGQLSMMGCKAVTVGAGEHPLFNGVKKVIFTGFESEPQVIVEEDSIKVAAEGLELDFKGSAVEISEMEVKILLSADR